ncbi:MAG: right-handed parallel beta-helix repeat-containing protein [Caldilineaceae bacterium]|nr:right-handed parallel beta-helix repeat-containing protein [Caldilineaceae bacterium]
MSLTQHRSPHPFRAQRTLGLRLVVASYLFFCSFLLSSQVYAQGAPQVTYNPGNNIITIGSLNGAIPGSQSITLPAVAATLAGAGAPDVLVDQGGGVWLTKARIVVAATGRLEATRAAGMTELRLESILAVGSPTYIQVNGGGQLLIEGIKVVAWDSVNNQVDEEISNGRAYIVAQNGSRLDIRDSDLGYLGDATNSSTSGVAWVKRQNPADPTTGATGSVVNSKFHHNYHGLFIADGTNITILTDAAQSGQTTEVANNLNHGIFVRDGAQGVTISGVAVHDNGNKGTNSGDGIVLYNNAVQNTIQSNTIYANARHGILLDNEANNNIVIGNTIYQQSDGLAVSDSDNNLIQNNHARNNRNGIRVSGALNNPAANNQLIGNLIEDSASDLGNAYGIYLYAHADNNLLRNNTILRSATYGIYIKSGANRLEGNVIREGKTGIALVGEAESMGQIPLLALAGSANVVISSTISNNTDIGIRVEGGVGNGIGADPTTGAPLVGNLIESNLGNGIFLKSTTAGDGSTDNWIVNNTIRTNGSSGIVVAGNVSLRNRLSQNRITNNAGSGIKLDGGAQQGILPPVISEIRADGQAIGTATANATIELYSDPGSEGESFLGTATADGSGAWAFQLPVGQDPKRVTALAIDSSGNSSAFSTASGSSVDLFTSVAVDEQNQPLIQLTGAGAVATLDKIQTLLGVANADLLQNLGNGVWRLNANLKVETEVTLNIGVDEGVTELQLRSAANPVSSTVDYAGFVYIRTHNGTININGAKIYGWDPILAKFDDTISDGRAFIVAKYGATLNITNSEISYLGSPAHSESYGVTWRDDAQSEISAASAAGILRTAVTGEVSHSKFHHNYVGVHLMQAGDLRLTNNEFYANLSYGFYARDHSRDTLLEGNLAYNNAAHGILLARGCTNFTLRNNKAYTNGASFAHGIVISQGSAPTAASVENLLEGNEAYDNRGYGINIEGSNNNEVRNNNLHNNQTGLTVEDGSTNNNIHDNTFRENASYGLQTRLGSNQNRLANNLATANSSYGFYLRSDGNQLVGNQVTGSTDVGIQIKPENAIPLQNNEVLSNTIFSNSGSGIDIRAATNTQVSHNRIESNGGHGVYLTDGAVGTAINENIIQGNALNGIRVNTALSYQNHWAANAIYGNQQGGIMLSAGANSNVPKPKITEIKGRTVVGRVNSPNATIELYSDAATQGRVFLGSTTADAAGNFALVVEGSFYAPANLTAIATDTQGNSSEFGESLVVQSEPLFYLFLPSIQR